MIEDKKLDWNQTERNEHRFSTWHAITQLKHETQQDGEAKSAALFNPLIADRKWLHALKLGILFEEEFHDGGRDNDNEIPPNHPLLQSSMDEENTENQSIGREAVLNPDESVSEDIPSDKSQEKATTELVINESTFNETKETAAESIASGERKDESFETEAQSDTSIADDEGDDDDSSPFVRWLKKLPDVVPIDSAKEKKKKKDKKGGKEKKKKKKEKKDKKGGKEKKKKKKEKKGKKSTTPLPDKKKSKKKRSKSKKASKLTHQLGSKKTKTEKIKKEQLKSEHSDDVLYQERLTNSLLLSEKIASETLANLLKAHGHIDLAREMYRRLALENPEKSGYYTTLIENLNLEK